MAGKGPLTFKGDDRTRGRCGARRATVLVFADPDRGAVRLALCGVAAQPGHGAVECRVGRAGRQHLPAAFRPRYAASRLRAGVSRCPGRAVEPARVEEHTYELQS